MSLPPQTPLAGKAELVEYLESGCKKPDLWRIGTEHEKFAFRLSDLAPPSYGETGGIGDFLKGMERFGWEAVREDGHTIALLREGASITLEPGGQIELSGAPLSTLHQTCDEVHVHLKECKEVCAELGLGLMGMGFLPKWTRDEIPWMPKPRYGIMRAYMPTRGNLGLDMMLRTATVQVNLDFQSEACMTRKFRVGLALQPVVTALFANSPFIEGKPSGFLSARSNVWTDTDPDRCGILPFVFEDGFGFERYVDYMLDVPMYFVRREGKYIDASGQSFRDFMDGSLPALPGVLPTMADWEDHLTTVFPEVRLKRFLEMRGADGGPWKRLCALSALWTGLLYDEGALDAAWDLVKSWEAEEHARLRAEVPRLGLKTSLGNHSLREVALSVLEIAREGLKNRNRVNKMGENECFFLDSLSELAEKGITPAEEWLEAFSTRWQGRVEPIYQENAY